MNEQIILIIILIFSVVIHEVSHGLAAYFQGDKTAENAGRLTLNPIPHIDLFGSIILPGIFLLSGTNAFLAWAKPVPYNPNNLKNKKWGELIVALAGPISNFILMLIFLLLLAIVNYFNISNEFIIEILKIGGFLNLFLGIFNLLPIVPLDGSKILFAILPKNISYKMSNFMEKNYLYIFIIFLLFIFNTNYIFNFVFLIFNQITKFLL